MSMGMRKALVAALVLLAMTSVVIVRCMRMVPRDRLRLRGGGGQERCLNYMEMCVPWENNCCSEMSCTNFGKGFCMHGLEPCICQLTFHVDVS